MSESLRIARYRKSAKGRATRKRWRQSAAGKDIALRSRPAKRVWARRYLSDPKNRLAKRIYDTLYRLAFPEKKTNYVTRARRIFYTYGLTAEEHEALIKKQAGRCAICRRKRPLHVDHRHRDGKVRGLLCFGCNAGIGQLQESKQILARAIKYLSR